MRSSLPVKRCKQLMFSPKPIWINTSGSSPSFMAIYTPLNDSFIVIISGWPYHSSTWSLPFHCVIESSSTKLPFLMELEAPIETRFYQHSFQGRRASARSGASSTRVTRGANGPNINVQFISFPRCWNIVKPILRVICDQICGGLL